mgnify:CR=1 FL=1
MIKKSRGRKRDVSIYSILTIIVLILISGGCATPAMSVVEKRGGEESQAETVNNIDRLKETIKKALGTEDLQNEEAREKLLKRTHGYKYVYLDAKTQHITDIPPNGECFRMIVPVTAVEGGKWDGYIDQLILGRPEDILNEMDQKRKELERYK